jgi:hypothetical protein
MDRERAETYLRLLAEAELRHAMRVPMGSTPGWRRSARLAVVAQALTAVGAVAADVADEIQAELGLALAGRHRLSGPGPGWGRIRPTPRRPSWRVVPVGQVLKVRNDDDVRRDVLLVAYMQSAGAARFIVVGRPSERCTAADDMGGSYQVGWMRGPGASELLVLRPHPPHQIRWLDLTTAGGEPATRINLDPQVTVPAVTVTRTAHSPGELMLDGIAARILTTVPRFSPDNPRQLPAANADQRAFFADRPGYIVAALHGAGLLPPDSPAPGQLAGLFTRLGINGHGITAPPAADLPERWQSMLTSPSGSQPQATPEPGLLAATVVELPELVGADFAIVGLHQGERGTIMHLLARGVTVEDDWEYSRGVRPLPTLWIHDADGRWHATHTDGVIAWGDTGVVAVTLRIIPPLDRGTAWIDIAAAGRSAEVRAMVPLSSTGGSTCAM